MRQKANKHTRTHTHIHGERHKHTPDIRFNAAQGRERERGRRGLELRPSHGARAAHAVAKGQHFIICAAAARVALAPCSASSSTYLPSISPSPCAGKQLASCVKGQRGETERWRVKRKLRQCRESQRGANVQRDVASNVQLLSRLTLQIEKLTVQQGGRQ